MPLRFLTAGESHGPALTVVVEGLPAGIPVPCDVLDRDLRRRMGGYGRGGRMKIESDRVELLGGVRFSRTLGSPVSIVIRNVDHSNWTAAMAPEGEPSSELESKKVVHPRPGHADLAGALKYGTHDARNILERASARETTARTAAGALARCLLRELGIEVTSRTVSVGAASAASSDAANFDELAALSDDAPFRCLDAAVTQAMGKAVDEARAKGDSLGGVFEVLARGVPPGLGSHVHWDRKLDARLGAAILSINAVKAVSIGEGIEGAARAGSEHHDPISYDHAAHRFERATNHAGGIEGGMSNGEIVRVTGYLKPLATLPQPLASVNLENKTAFHATIERTDTIPIVAAGVVGEAMVCLILADEMLRKFGGDSITETRRNLDAYQDGLRSY